MNLFKNIGFWLKLNHLQRIRQYGLFTHIKYVFNWNVNKINICVQRDFADLPQLSFPKNVTLKKMNINDNDEINDWCNLINSSFNDIKADPSLFEKHIHQHSFLIDVNVLFIIKNNKPIGTISFGRYRKDPSVSGGSLAAVLPSEQGYLHYFIINYGCHYFRNKGIMKGEANIQLKRKSALILHFRHGFIPQFDRKQILFDDQRRMWPARLIARKRIEKLYNKVLASRMMNKRS